MLAAAFDFKPMTSVERLSIDGCVHAEFVYSALLGSGFEFLQDHPSDAGSPMLRRDIETMQLLCAWDDRSKPYHVAARIASDHCLFWATLDALCQSLHILGARRSPVLNDFRIIEVRRRATNCRPVHNKHRLRVFGSCQFKSNAAFHGRETW